ncbi:MAG: hypothetical protein ACKOW5_06120, partial [Actinomycetales bacterium]
QQLLSDCPVQAGRNWKCRHDDIALVAAGVADIGATAGDQRESVRAGAPEEVLCLNGEGGLGLACPRSSRTQSRRIPCTRA